MGRPRGKMSGNVEINEAVTADSIRQYIFFFYLDLLRKSKRLFLIKKNVIVNLSSLFKKETSPFKDDLLRLRLAAVCQ